jgi:hypothetical protein
MAMFLMMTFDMLLTNLKDNQYRMMMVEGFESQPKASEAGTRVLSNDAGIAFNLDLIGSLSDRPIDNDDLLFCS